MVEVLENIIEKKALMMPVPREWPKIIGSPGEEDVIFTNIKIPDSLRRRFFQRCGIDIKRTLEEGITNREAERKIYETTFEKRLYLRFADWTPLSVVTDKFREISPSELAHKASRITGTKPRIRYFKTNESLQLNFPIDTRFKGMHIVLNTGDYGVYAGSGLNAVSYGITWYNQICANWTVFLDKLLRSDAGRIIHTASNGMEEKLNQMLLIAERVEGRIDQSKHMYFTPEELDKYFAMYENKGLNKKIMEQIKQENPKGLSAYDLSYRLTELSQDNKLSDVTRARTEYIAGEVILCYDEIKDKILAGQEQNRTRATRVRRPLIDELPRRYISLH